MPVTALHIWSKQNKWQPVKYNPGALVVNLGEALEIVSGGHFKATKHKVTDTPEDQEHCERLSLVQFNASIGDMRLAPAVGSPLLQREGFVFGQGVFQQYKKLMDAGVPVSLQTALMGSARCQNIMLMNLDDRCRQTNSGVKYRSPRTRR